MKLFMPKRFTDTDKWKKPFIRSLEAPYKLLWFYILDDCDHAGIWIVDFEVASIRIGEDISEEKAREVFQDKIDIMDGGERWFIRDFIEFQYGNLKPENRLHNSVLYQLSKYNIKDLTRTLQGPSEGPKVKDKDKDKDKDKRGLLRGDFVKMTDEEVEKLIEKFGQELTKIAIERLDNYIGSTGKKYKSHYRAILSWVMDDVKKKNGSNAIKRETFTGAGIKFLSQ